MDKKYCPYCMSPVEEGGNCSVCGLTEGSYVPSPHHLPPGTVLMERYLVGRVLGEGGFGITYIGCDLRLEMKVAIKEYYPLDRATRNASASLEISSFIGPSSASYERGKQKFLSEAQVMARMDKQQVIVNVRDFFEIHNTAYIVMEYIEGITFHELVEKKGGRIPPQELFPMIEPLFSALSAIHENGLIHRDISPDNLMLENGRIRLLDFGCAREASRGTETMTIALKHGYAPIEQYQQKGQGPWTDIYALSATIYYCLTGKVPPQALDRIAEDELLLPGKLGVGLTKRQEQALLKGMRLQPSRRYSNVKELWAALYTEPVQETETGQPAAPGHSPVQKASMDRGPQERALGKPGGPPDRKAAEPGSSDTQKQDTRPVTGSYADAGTQTETAHDAAGGRKKKIIRTAAGIAVACIVLVLLGTGIYRSYIHQSGGHSTGDIAASGGAVAERGTVADSKDAEDVYIPGEKDFQDAYVFTSGTAEEFQKLMNTASVSEVIMDGDGYAMMTEIEITKPVWLKKDAKWQADNITVLDDGFLLVEGTLDMQAGGYVRLRGEDTCLCVAQDGEFCAKDVFLWMDNDDCFYTQSGGELPASHLILSEEAFTDAVSVSDAQTLAKVAQQGRRIRIDADIVLTDSVGFTAPVQIAEGVTVSAVQPAENDEERVHFVLEEGAVLVNEGALESCLLVQGGSVAVNNGSFAGKASGMVQDVSLWIEEEGSTLVNFGTVNAGDVSRFWKGSLCLNMGDLRVYDMYLEGGDMVNFADITLPERDISLYQEQLFQIGQGSMMWNKDHATVTVHDGAAFHNYGKVHNRKGGSIHIKNGGEFRNALLENNGSFQAETGAWLDDQWHGVYYGEGEFDIEDEKIKVYHVPQTVTVYPQDTGSRQYVQNEEELLAALEDADTEAVLVTKDITVQEDITVTKTLFVDGSLAMAGNARLTGDGGYIVILPGASLQGDDIMLQEDAQLYMWGDSSLMVGQDGSLALDSALLWGSGDIRLDNARFILDNRSALALSNTPSGDGSLEAGQCEVRIQDNSSFVAAPGGGLRLEGAAVTMRDSRPESAASNFCCVSDITFVDCTLDIDTGMFSGGADVKLVNGALTVGEDAQFNVFESNLSILGSADVKIWGLVEIGGWDEQIFTVHGRITNYGDMYIWVRLDASEEIDNQGRVVLAKGVDASGITGNEPVIEE